MDLHGFDLNLLVALDALLREKSVGAMPQSIVPPARPHELLFRDTFTCLVWRDNTDVGDRLTVDQFTTLGHVVVTCHDDCTTSDDD
jgi:hypothetical protein